MEYKVWVQIEKIDEDGNTEDISEPDELAGFATEVEAEEYAGKICQAMEFYQNELNANPENEA